MDKNQTQQIVRQRAGFKCEECGNSTMGQYAHIIPSSWGGSYEFQNLLFLCNDCHRKFDVNVFRKGSNEANSTIKAMQKVRDKGAKERGAVENHFIFITNYNQTIVKIGEGITIKGSSSILSTDDGTNLLSVDFLDDRLILNGVFYDEHSNILLEISNNKFRAHGDTLWDLAIVNCGDLTLQSKDEKIKINLRFEDPFLILSGKIYLSKNYIEANMQGIGFNGNPPILRKNTLIGSGLILNREGGISF